MASPIHSNAVRVKVSSTTAGWLNPPRGTYMKSGPAEGPRDQHRVAVAQKDRRCPGRNGALGDVGDAPRPAAVDGRRERSQVEAGGDGARCSSEAPVGTDSGPFDLGAGDRRRGRTSLFRV